MAAIFRAGVLAFALSALGATASAQTVTMKFGTATANDDQHQFILIFKEEIEKATGGRIVVQAFPASQLGAIPRQIEGLQLGTVEAFVGPADFFVGLEPRFGVFSAPTLFATGPTQRARWPIRR